MIFAFAVIVIFASCQSTNSNSGNSSGSTNNSNTGSVETSGSGKDVFIEMANNTSGKQMQLQANTKMYLAANGKVRMEMVMAMNNKPSSEMISIGDASHPYENMVLDDSAKTYYINHVDTADMGKADEHTKYTVNKIGEETIAGFHCTHARVIATKNYNAAASFMNSVDTTDLWLSPDVPIPAPAKKYMDLATGKMSGLLFSASVASQLKQMGCEGFMVKFAMRSKNTSSVSQITKVRHDNFPASLFEVPAGYKQTEGM